MIIDKEKFMEIASRGVSQKTWDSFTEIEKKDYIQKNPTSKYANPNNTLPTQIKPRNKTVSLDSIKYDIKNEIRKCLGDDLIECGNRGLHIDNERSNNKKLYINFDVYENENNTGVDMDGDKYYYEGYYEDICLHINKKFPGVSCRYCVINYGDRYSQYTDGYFSITNE